AAGNDDVVWPDEPPNDWLWKLFYLGGLVLVSLLLGGLLSSLVLPFVLKWITPLGGVALVAAVAGLVFPFLLLSSLGGESLTMLIAPVIVGRLLRRPRALLVYCLATGALWAGWGALFVLTFPGGWGWLLPVAAALWPPVLLVHARLLGRLAWLV